MNSFDKFIKLQREMLSKIEARAIRKNDKELMNKVNQGKFELEALIRRENSGRLSSLIKQPGTIAN